MGVVVVTLLFVPWQAALLAQSVSVTSRVKQSLLGESVLEAAGPMPGPAVRSLADPLHDYGIAVSGKELSALGEEALIKRLNDIRAVGVGWLRFDMRWETVQPNAATVYDWSSYDRIVKAAASRQFKIIATLTGTPTWARKNCVSLACPPADPAQFAAFAARAATRYQPMGLQVWEIWQQPNTALAWAPKPDAAAYAKLLQATYPAIRIANPQAIVISGGLSPWPTDDKNIAEIDYLPQLYKAGAKGYFDALGAHPYTYPFIPSHNSQQGWSRLAFTANNLRATMTANGDAAKKIWITEFGAPTGGSGSPATMENHRTHQATHVDEELQAQIISRANELYRTYDWAGPLIWYTYSDPGRMTAGGHNFGLLREDGTKKPAFTALQKAITGR